VFVLGHGDPSPQAWLFGLRPEIEVPFDFRMKEGDARKFLEGGEVVDTIARWLSLAGVVVAIVTLGAVLSGLWQGMRRPKGRTMGLAQAMLRWPIYLIIGLFFFGVFFSMATDPVDSITVGERCNADAWGIALLFRFTSRSMGTL
jgi:Na+-driven multidrug efflux pump